MLPTSTLFSERGLYNRYKDNKRGEQVVIYGDILFILNMSLDYLLIGLTAVILKREIRTYRQVLSALFGGVSSFYIFLEINHFAFDILYRILVSAVMILIAFGFKGFRAFVRSFFLNLTLSLLLSGITDMLVSIFKTNAVTVNNTIIYIGISPILLIAVSVVFYFAIKLIFRLKKNTLSNEICDVSLMLGENTGHFKALLDSGNSITDILSDSEILIVSESAIKKICMKSIDEYFSDDENKARCRLIPIETVAGSTLLKAVRCDGAKIFLNDKSYELKRPIVAQSLQKLKDEYDMIIPLGALKGR